MTTIPTWLYFALVLLVAVGPAVGLSLGFWAGLRAGRMAWRAAKGLDPYPRKASGTDVEETQ